MARNILKEICDRRLDDIKTKGFSYGHAIPEKRTRPVVPFLPKPGTILEVKRASPSKGDIAPDLDAVKTALSYISAGTAAISVLTEENYFKGSLEDLVAVAEAAGEKAAVLRKDFLLEPEEIEIAYRCGADAVLLIARILETGKLLEMASRAFSLGLSILLELRDEEAVDKAVKVLELAERMNASDKVVLGINARDLKTFQIDMLIPLRIKAMIEEKTASKGNVRVISESGVLSPEAAAFTARLGFQGILIGEAVAKDAEKAGLYVKAFVDNACCGEGNGSFWKKVATRLNAGQEGIPLVKICGLSSAEDAVKATECGAAFLGFVAERKFARHAELDRMEGIRATVERFCREKNMPLPLFIGIVTDTGSEEAKAVFEMQKKGVFDGIQFHGCSGDPFLGYEAVRLENEGTVEGMKAKFISGHPRILVDTFVKGVDGGSGVRIPADLLEKAVAAGKIWIAGGIRADNVKDIISAHEPELVDVSSGVELDVGKKDYAKLESLFKNIGNL